MLFIPDHQNQVQRLLSRIQDATVPDTRLFADVIANACPRTLALIEMRKAARLKELLESGAWTDAALALAEFELPQWKPRRIVYDDGEWHCRFSAQPWLPEDFDDEVVETFHTVLALAILAAVVEARQQTATTKRSDEPAADVAVTSEPIRICCDNFR